MQDVSLGAMWFNVASRRRSTSNADYRRTTDRVILLFRHHICAKYICIEIVVESSHNYTKLLSVSRNVCMLLKLTVIQYLLQVQYMLEFRRGCLAPLRKFRYTRQLLDLCFWHLFHFFKIFAAQLIHPVCCNHML